MKVEVRGVRWGTQSRQIIDSIDLAVQSGETIGLIGPNGSGKSSLLRLIYRMFPPNDGVVLLDERNIWKLSPRSVAQNEAVVGQEAFSSFDFTVEEIVLMGRTPHKRLFDLDTSEDDIIAHNALARVDMKDFGQRLYGTLSGGEKQRVLIARALAQEARVLILDEPTNHLDIRSQLEILDTVRNLGVTTIVALHDLNLAATYCDRLYLMHSGRIVTSGYPDAVLTPQVIESVYGVSADLDVHPSTGKLHIMFSLNSHSE